MFAGKKLNANEEMIAESEAYFETNEKSHPKKLSKSWKIIVLLSMAIMLNNEIAFFQKSVLFQNDNNPTYLYGNESFWVYTVVIYVQKLRVRQMGILL